MRVEKRPAGRAKWGGKRESNPQPPEPQSGALPVELFPPQPSDYSKRHAAASATGCFLSFQESGSVPGSGCLCSLGQVWTDFFIVSAGAPAGFVIVALSVNINHVLKFSQLPAGRGGVRMADSRAGIERCVLDCPKKKRNLGRGSCRIRRREMDSAHWHGDKRIPEPVCRGRFRTI
jgi:hypothetical protein